MGPAGNRGGEPSAANPRTYPKTARVLRSAQFRKVYDTGVRLPGPLFVAFLLARPEGEANEGARLGLTVPRAIGGSVERNLIKRRLREAFRQRRDSFGPYDIVLNPRRAILKAGFPDIERALDRLAAQNIMERSRT